MDTKPGPLIQIQGWPCDGEGIGPWREYTTGVGVIAVGTSGKMNCLSPSSHLTSKHLDDLNLTSPQFPTL